MKRIVPAASAICLATIVVIFYGCGVGTLLDSNDFTLNEPNASDLVGTWDPTAVTLKDMQEQGGYTISQHELTFRSDKTFLMTNMPDWWKDGFGKSKKSFESGSGTWKAVKSQDAWVIQLDFGSNLAFIQLENQKSPYKIHIYVGDPDSGHAMIFERKS